MAAIKTLKPTSQGYISSIYLDGGGSTMLWVDGFPDNGVINYPIDNKNRPLWRKKCFKCDPFEEEALNLRLCKCPN
ncbi:hypothetical protein ACVWYN_000360 [Pedobacter sp. UYP24]